MRMKRGSEVYVMVVCAVMLGLEAVAANQGLPPSLTAARCGQAPVTDGDLSDACWQEAAKATDFVLYNTGKKASVPTEAYVAYDDDHLYIAFRCSEPHPGQVRTEVKHRDGPLFSDDCVEVFLHPGGEAYYHFTLNSANVQGDQRCAGGTRDLDWNGDWKSATSVGADFWTAEMAIPFYNFAGDIAPGQPWRLNLGREKYTEPKEISSWSYSPETFHRPERFGRLTGVSGDLGRFNLLVEGLTAGKYSVEGESYACLVEAEVENNTGTQRALTAQVIVFSILGYAPAYTLDLSLANHERKQIAIRVPMNAAQWQSRDLQFRLRDSQTGKPCYVAQVPSAPVIEAYLDRSYYTTEKIARLLASLSLGGVEGNLQLKLSVTSQGGRADEKTVTVKDPSRIEVPVELEKLTPGSYQVTLSLSDPKRVALGAVSVSLVKLPPGKGSEVKIDQVNMVALVDGKPFFPFGIYMLFPPEQMKDYAQLGFNTVVAFEEKATIEDGKKCLDTAQALGMKVVDWACRYMGQLRYRHPDFREQFQKGVDDILPKVARSFKDHPALLAYYTPDEPNLADKYMKGEGRKMVELCQDYYRTIKEIDPYHPVYGLFSARISTSPGWSETYDLAGVDPYWRPTKGETPLYICYWTDKAVETTQAKRAPTWLVPMASMWSASLRSITRQEQRCQTYLALIHGAKGLLYYYGPVHYQPLLEEFKALAKETKQLAPIVLSATPPQEISVKPEKLNATIHVLAKHYGGKLYLLTANAASLPVEAHFRLSGCRAGKAKVWFENRNLAIRKGGFSDRFDGYATRVYEIPAQQSGPIRLEVEVSVPKAKVAIHEAEAAAFMPPVNNLIPNPSFEEDLGWEFTDWDREHHNVVGEFEGGGHSGDRCVGIHRTHTISAAQFVSQPITLEPNTRYRLGGYVKSDTLVGVSARTIFLLGPKDIVPGTEVFASGRPLRLPWQEAEWQRYSVNFATGAEPITARVYCRLGNCVGSAWFDDVFLVKIPPEETVNLLHNSSLEMTTNPGWPDYWVKYGNDAIWRHGLIGAEGTDWAPDEKVAFHGKQSLRVWRKEPAGDEVYKWALATRYDSYFPIVGGKEYTFSIYMKSDRPKVPVLLGMVNTPARQTEVKVTTEWKRYVLTGKLSADRTETLGFFYLLGPGTIWVDAAQFEQGSEAHPYVPAEE